jgi:hypothetical protein
MKDVFNQWFERKGRHFWRSQECGRRHDGGNALVSGNLEVASTTMASRLAARKANAISLLSRFAQRQARAQTPREDGQRWRIRAGNSEPIFPSTSQPVSEQPNPFLNTKDAKGRTVPPIYSARRVKKLVQAAEALKDEYTVELPALPRRLIPREERESSGRLFHKGKTPFDKFYRGHKWEREASQRKANIKEKLTAQPQRIEQWKQVSLAFGHCL